MSGEPAVADQGATLLTLYDRALPQVYGYLLPRAGAAAVAEDLTAETFLAAVSAVQRGTVPDLTVAWLVGVARHKLVDHWRRQAAGGAPAQGRRGDGRALGGPVGCPPGRHHRPRRPGGAGSHHRGALTLRYLDGLSVPEVAEALGRTVHATEALLVRARTAFRRAYGEGTDDAC